MKKTIAALTALSCVVGAFAYNDLLNCSDRTFSLPSVRYMHKIRPAYPGNTVSVDNLPEGLTWNERRSLVEGVIENPGEYYYNVIVSNTDTVPIHLTVSNDLTMPTPMMGWLSWNVVLANVSDSLMRQTADAFHEKGLYDAGYRWLGIDDDWHIGQIRPTDGKPKPNPDRFPNGMKAVGDYLHSRGFKFGIYSTAAHQTCDSKFGSYLHEDTDAQAYADWGVDFLKYDYCHVPSLCLGDTTYQDRSVALYLYGRMRDAIKKTGRPIVLYMCEWGSTKPWQWAHEAGAPMWRATHDHRDGWVGYPDSCNANVRGHGIGMRQELYLWRDLWPYTGVNHFSDADMLCIGIRGRGMASNIFLDGVTRDKELGWVKDGKPYYGMTPLEAQTEFIMWCMWSSPLLLSFDARDYINQEDLDVITNPELIAINQDPMGQAAEYINEKGGVQLWAKDLADGSVAVAAVNMNPTSVDYTIEASEINALDPTKTYSSRNPLLRLDEAPFSGSATYTIPSHATKILILK